MNSDIRTRLITRRTVLRMNPCWIFCIDANSCWVRLAQLFDFQLKQSLLLALTSERRRTGDSYGGEE
jgi:hypothetical protein